MDCMSIYIQIKRLREVFINIMYIHRRNSQCLKSREKCEEFNVSLKCLRVKEEAQFLHTIPRSSSCFKSFLPIFVKTSFNVEIVRSGFVNSKLSKTFAVGLKVPYHFRLSITSGATFNSLAKCLQFFTALVISMSNLLVIFSTASGLSFMKAENKDSKRKEKMYIMIKLLRLYSLVTLRDLLWKKTQEFFMNLQN